MSEHLQKQIEALLDYNIRNDARFMALETAIADHLFDKNTEQKEAFRAEVEQNFKIFYNAILKQSEEVDPALVEKLRRGSSE